MSQLLINHSPDLKRLRDEGYELQIKGGYLIVHSIPYVNSRKEIKFGALVSDLTLQNSELTARPNTHVIYFSGEHPCNKDGTIITAIQHNSLTRALYDGLVINHAFSNKPPNGYEDYYKKISRYADIISAPAKSIDHSVTEKTFKVIPEENAESVFNYIDTNSSRAQIHHLNLKFSKQKIAIIGLGGTGAYILDLVAKAPVAEIHLYDGDAFLQHNAFRSPGASSVEKLKLQLKKAEYYREIYSAMHRHIHAHCFYINKENLDKLDGMSYVFVCIDKNDVRKNVIDFLLIKKIPFIDVGLGVNHADGNLIGTIRVTTGTSAKCDHLNSRIPFEDDDNNEYNTNVQIADLNALNASLAVIKWKKLSGFYQDLKEEYHTTYSLNVSQLLNNDYTA